MLDSLRNLIFMQQRMQKPEAKMGIGELMNFADRRQKIRERFSDPEQRRQAFGEGLITAGDQISGNQTQLPEQQPLQGNLPPAEAFQRTPGRGPMPNLLNSQMGPNWRGQVPTDGDQKNRFGQRYTDYTLDEWPYRSPYPGMSPMRWMGP